MEFIEPGFWVGWMAPMFLHLFSDIQASE